MKIGVLSDTHIPARAQAIPTVIWEIFKSVDLILHAGDLVEETVLEELSVLAPVKAVAGNMDSFYLREKLGTKKLITLASGIKIGLTHGVGFPASVPGFAFDTFAGKSPDCIVFGHSHKPYNQLHRGVLLFNPGSPTDKRGEKYPSCGLLEITGGKIKGEIIHLK